MPASAGRAKTGSSAAVWVRTKSIACCSVAALLSAQQGLGVLLLEQSAKRHIQSRANGITPSSLEILSQLGLAEVFIEHGVAVRVSEV